MVTVPTSTTVRELGHGVVRHHVCRAAAAIKKGLQNELTLGDTRAQRDWGHARDYVRGMWLSLQHATPDDYLFATGKLHSVQDVIETAFAALALDWRNHVKFDAHFLRPAEPLQLVGDASKARTVLGWSPQTPFTALIQEMTRAELDTLA